LPTRWRCLFPTWSPDGQTITFSLITGAITGHQALFSVDLANPGVAYRTTPTFPATGAQDAPSYSVDGSKIAFSGILDTSDTGSDSVFVYDFDDGETHRIAGPGKPIENSNVPTKWMPSGQVALPVPGIDGISAGVDPGSGQVEDLYRGSVEDWTPDGKYVIVGNSASGRSSRVDLNTGEVEPVDAETNWYRQGGISYPHPNFLPAAAPVTTLLDRYRPEMRNPRQEQHYFADSAAEATDNLANTLQSDSGVILAGHGSNAPPTLSLDLLGEQTGEIGADQRIDENDNYAEDVDVLRGLQNGDQTPTYADQIYGRPVGSTILQYWFWFYYDNLSFSPLHVGFHEGDWEMFQVMVDRFGRPRAGTDARHAQEEHETCPANRMRFALQPDLSVVPEVYTALGSHASYFAPGDYPRGFDRPSDDANGEGYRVRPRIAQVLSDSGPAWLNWQGRWGGSRGGLIPGEAESPKGPKWQGLDWDEPQTWAASVNPCSVDSVDAP
jgi:hypothetical protein